MSGTGRIVAGMLAPHPPHLVYADNPPQNEPTAECGWETLRWGYDRARKDLEARPFDVIVVLTAHWQTYVGTHFLGLPHFKSLSVDPIFPNLFRFQYDLTVDVALAEGICSRAADAGLEYGLLVDDISGGFTLTGRRMPNAFDVKVVVGYRVYVDGRPDELVRGLDLIGTPLVTFGRIELAGDRPEVFNGSCGAESGWVPVSAIAPSLLVGEVETQRKPRGQQTPPLLPPPVAEGVEP